MLFPTRPDGTRCLDRREWIKSGYKSILEQNDSFIILQVHDEINFDVPITISQDALKEMARIMANTIPNDVGIAFKSDIEISPYWGGAFTKEQISQLNAGTLNWKEVFENEVKTKLYKFGIEYKVGDFEYDDDDEQEQEENSLDEVI